MQCFCVGADGLQNRPGVFPDGRQCQQATQVDLYVQSKTIIVRAQKPGNYSEKLAVTVRVDGETSFSALYSMVITHYFAGVGNHTNVTWPSIHDQTLALNGFALIWDTPPSSDAQLQLNADASQFTATKSYAFQLQLDCASLDGKGQRCIADGDRVEAVMQIGSPLDSSGMRSEVRFITEVEALVSCERSQAWVERDISSLPPESSFRVRLAAFDVDGQAVRFTRTDIVFLFDNRSLPVQWSQGSNEYTALVSAALTKAAGDHELVVRVTSGWNETVSRAQSCDLLHRVITVVPDRSQLILAGCLASVLLLAAGALGHLLYKNRGKASELLISFLSFEGLLLVEFLLEVWGGSPSAHTLAFLLLRVRVVRAHRYLCEVVCGHCCAYHCVLSALQILRVTASSSPLSSKTGRRTGLHESTWCILSSSP